MEDLDAELLAVTEGQKRRAPLSENSGSSGGEFEGMMDSDAGEDDDAMMGADDDDDDDDDDEFDLDDDDDDDYAAKSKSRVRKKGSASRPKKAKARPKQKRKPSSKTKPTMPSDDDDEDDIFEYKYDAAGYGDSADRDRLARMNEVDRETLLAERVDQRQKEYEMWTMRRELRARESGKNRDAAGQRANRSSGRNKASSKSDALQALAEHKRKKTSRGLVEVSDADSEGERERPRREKREDARADKEKPKDEPKPMDDDEGPELRYADLVDEQGKTSPLFMRRSQLIELSQEPYFERVVMGLFVRIRRLGQFDDAYMVCRIIGVEKREAYPIPHSGGMRSNFHLRLQIGRTRKLFTIPHMSGSHALESDFKEYRIRTLDNGQDMPRRDEVDKLRKKAFDMMYRKKPIPTEEENKKHIANMELLYPARVNWTRKRTEASTALQIKRQALENVRRRGSDEAIGKLKREVDTLAGDLREIEANEKQYGVKSARVEQTDQEVFTRLAERNKMLNTNNDLLMARRRSLEADGGGIDPFARFDTTGQSYFSVNKKGEAGDGPKVGSGAEQRSVGKQRTRDWRSGLKTWRAGGKRRKISDNAVDPMYAVELVGLDDFSKEIPSNGDAAKDLQRVPPGIDAVYADGAKKNRFVLPENAKVISFEEWTKMRT